MKIQPIPHDLKISTARRLRKQPNAAERWLWARVRGGSLGCRFRRQHVLLGFIVDFYAPKARLIVEIGDCPSQSREDALSGIGVKILRISHDEFHRDPSKFLAAIAAEVQARNQK